jgi:hypothetical protein
MSNQNSIFSSIISSDKGKNADEPYDSKFSQRIEQISSQTTSFEKFKEEALEKDLSLKKDDKENEFKIRRMKKITKIEYAESLVDKLTVPKSLFEDCNKLKVNVS